MLYSYYHLCIYKNINSKAEVTGEAKEIDIMVSDVAFTSST